MVSHSTLMPIASMVCAEHVARLGIELSHHQLRRRFEDGYVYAVRQQTARRFESQQAAADDRRPPALPGVVRDMRAVVDGAEQECSRSAEPLHRRHERPRAGCDDDFVVWLFDGRPACLSGRVSAVREGILPERVPDDHSAFPIDVRGLDAGMQRMPWSRYHASGFMKMSVAAWLPLSTLLNRMRL